MKTFKNLKFDYNEDLQQIAGLFHITNLHRFSLLTEIRENGKWKFNNESEGIFQLKRMYHLCKNYITSQTFMTRRLFENTRYDLPRREWEE